MSLPLILLICLSVFHLCLGTQPEKRLLGEGGWSEKRPESKGVQRAAQYAVEIFNQVSEEKMLFKLVSVHSAKSKVTDTINFKIIAILGKTTCSKTINQDLNSCALDKQQLKCHFLVTLNPHDSKYELNTNKCHIITKKT